VNLYAKLTAIMRLNAPFRRPITSLMTCAARLLATALFRRKLSFELLKNFRVIFHLGTHTTGSGYLSQVHTQLLSFATHLKRSHRLFNPASPEAELN